MRQRVFNRFFMIVPAMLATAFLSGCATSGGGSGESRIDAAITPTLERAAAEAEAARDYHGATGHYRTLLLKSPEDERLVVAVARNQRYAGDMAGALATLDRHLAAGHKRSPGLLSELGKAHLAADHANLAVRFLREAEVLAPGAWDIANALGVAYDYQERYAEARASYDRALALSPDNPAILNNLGLSLAQTGKLDEAHATLSRAVDQP
ncbi:MAG: tetratricopeptide repeat protein, partial [Alphaproteobacteria bacterium]|nr:tetratricopeptide repeat protein [Alphaproteobacteria bacterium]